MEETADCETQQPVVESLEALEKLETSEAEVHEECIKKDEFKELPRSASADLPETEVSLVTIIQLFRART